MFNLFSSIDSILKRVGLKLYLKIVVGEKKYFSFPDDDSFESFLKKTDTITFSHEHKSFKLKWGVASASGKGVPEHLMQLIEVLNIFFLFILKQLSEIEEKNKEIDSLRRSLDEMSVELLGYGKESFETDGREKVEIIGESEGILKCKNIVSKVKDLAIPVLITGETGTGKELFAKMLHYESARSKHPFVTINCSAIPEDLFESELFGYEKGAFTGAYKTKKGLIELAHKGTLFIDEIGDMPLSLQAKILRTIQSNTLYRLGGREPIKFDVRIVSSANKNLEELVKNGKFRADLYYRISVVKVNIPPLRERLEDIPLLCDFFIKKINKIAKTQVREIDEKAVKFLQSYSFPGNVRELETIIHNAMLFETGNKITLETLKNLEIFEQDRDRDFEKMVETKLRQGFGLREMEKILLKSALKLTEGNKKRAAELLGIDRRTIYNKLKCLE